MLHSVNSTEGCIPQNLYVSSFVNKSILPFSWKFVMAFVVQLQFLSFLRITLMQKEKVPIYGGLF